MEKIKIIKLGRKQQPSKFKPGETYSITTILDEKGRKMSAMGAWSDNWKVNDEIEASIEEKKWTDRDGFEQTNMVLKNPNQQPYTRGGTKFNPVIQSFELAAKLAPLLFAEKKKVNLDDITELANEIKKRLNVPIIENTEKIKESVSVIEVKDEKEVSTNASDNDFDDDDKPF